MRKFIVTSLVLALTTAGAFAQGRRESGPDLAPKDPVVEAILKEEHDNSQLQLLSHELFDSI